MLSCREATRLLSASLDTPLPRLQRLRLSLHVLACAACRRFQEQLQQLQDVGVAFSERIDAGPADMRLSEEARARMLRAIEDEPESGTS